MTCTAWEVGQYWEATCRAVPAPSGAGGRCWLVGAAGALGAVGATGAVGTTGVTGAVGGTARHVAYWDVFLSHKNGASQQRIIPMVLMC